MKYKTIYDTFKLTDDNWMWKFQYINYSFQINDQMDVISCFNNISKKNENVIKKIYFFIKGPIIRGKQNKKVIGNLTSSFEKSNMDNTYDTKKSQQDLLVQPTFLIIVGKKTADFFNLN